MPTLEVKRTNPVLVGGAGLLIIAALIFGIRSLTRERIQVRVAHTSFQNLLRQVSTNGKVEPIQEFQAHASAPGVVAKLYVEVGDQVKPGTLLVKMADSQVQQQIADSQLSISTAQVGLDTIQQNGSQDERLGMTSDLNKAKLDQLQAAKDLAALQALQ